MSLTVHIFIKKEKEIRLIYEFAYTYLEFGYLKNPTYPRDA